LKFSTKRIFLRTKFYDGKLEYFGIFYFWQGIEMGHFPYAKKFSFVTTNQRNVLLHMIFITSL
jgi:hypothetical protein